MGDQYMDLVKRDAEQLFDKTGVSAAVWNSFKHPIEALRMACSTRSMRYVIESAGAPNQQGLLRSQGDDAGAQRQPRPRRANGRGLAAVVRPRYAVHAGFGFKDIEQAGPRAS